MIWIERSFSFIFDLEYKSWPILQMIAVIYVYNWICSKLFMEDKSTLNQEVAQPTQ